MRLSPKVSPLVICLFCNLHLQIRYIEFFSIHETTVNLWRALHSREFLLESTAFWRALSIGVMILFFLTTRKEIFRF